MSVKPSRRCPLLILPLIYISQAVHGIEEKCNTGWLPRVVATNTRTDTGELYVWAGLIISRAY